MSQQPTHFMASGFGATACGIDGFAPGMMRSSPHKAIVTCEECKGTVEFAQAVQRLPVQPPPPRYETIGKTR